MCGTTLLSALVLSISAVFAVASSTMSPTPSQCETPTNRQALNSLYFDTNGPFWKKADSNWNTTTDVSQWAGVTCFGTAIYSIDVSYFGLSGTLPGSLVSQFPRVQYLFLSFNNLTGTLPDAWSSFPAILRLYVDNNNLTGTLPASWAGLGGTLLELSLYSNKLSGTLPPEWSVLSKVTAFYLGYNMITGTLPPSWAALSSLSVIFLLHNSITGTLPDVWKSMTNLTIVNLAQNQLSGTLPSSWASLTNLNIIQFVQNSLTGSLPSEWHALLNLTAIAMDTCLLSGTLPVSWSSLVNLTTLTLSNNQINGTLPASWSSLTNLVKLQLFQNSISGTLPPSWSSLRNLTDLRLSYNEISGSLPDEWKSLSNLAVLLLGSNKLDGTIPPSLGSSFQKMTTLELCPNSISGTLPEAWNQMKSLTHLCLTQNNFSGALPPSWGTSFASMQKLYLNFNQFSGTLPPEWSGMKSLELLYVQNNNLSGTLPPEWGSLTNLSDFAAQNNMLSGTLPATWSSLSKLRFFIAHANNFSGQLPDEWSSWSSMFFMYVQLNRLTGTLPPSWSRLSNMQSLRLDVNNICGTLPPEWGSMKTLHSLELQSNRLSGPLPVSWSGLSSCAYLALHENNLEGTIPAEWKSMTAIKYMYLSSNWKLTGTLPSAWSTLTNLLALAVSSTSISGQLPDEWSSWTSLKTFYGFDANLSGTLPPSWSLMRSLTQLFCYNNSLEGTLPDAWKSFPNIITISLYDNNLAGTLPASWSALTSLAVLGLSSNKLTGTIPEGWKTLGGLTMLFLENNSFTGTLPPSWSSLSNMMQLALSQNNITGSLPDTWSSLRKISVLLLSTNNISGTLPASWSSMLAISVFDVSWNAITGTLPDAWDYWNGVTVLRFQHNRIAGTLPASWSRFASLRNFTFHFNQIEGTLPVEWSSLSQLNVLSANNNRLSGTIPSSWSELAALQYLNVSSNELSGSFFPDWWLLKCQQQAPSPQYDLHNNSFKNIPLEDAASRLFGNMMMPSFFSSSSSCISGNVTRVNLCGNRRAVNRSTMLFLESRGWWAPLQPLLFPGGCGEGRLWTASRSLSETSSVSCPAQVNAIDQAASQLSFPAGWTGPYPAETTFPVKLLFQLVAMTAAGGEVKVRINPSAGVVLTEILRSPMTTVGTVVDAIIDQGAAVLTVSMVSPNVGQLSLTKKSSLRIVADIAANGRCLRPNFTAHVSLDWFLDPTSSPADSSLRTATTATFRAATTASSVVVGNPVAVMSTTGMISMLGLDECMFSDVDPVDASVSPLGPIGIGEPVGQYYRGAAIVALMIYVGIALVASMATMSLHYYYYGSCGQQSIWYHLATLRMPSLGMIAVCIFEQGMATCGASLIRLAEGPVDVAIGIVALAVCTAFVPLSLAATTTWLQCRIVRRQKDNKDEKDELTLLPSCLRHFIKMYATWDSHWEDVSNDRYKKRCMMLIDDLRKPWWTALELSVSLVQGVVLGIRVNSLNVCRAQQWVLTVHSAAIFAASAWVRPCGTPSNNVFLVLGKAGTFIVALLLLLHTLTEKDQFGASAELATSIAALVASIQTLTQIATSITLLVSSPSRWRRLLRFIYGRGEDIKKDREHAEDGYTSDDRVVGVVDSIREGQHHQPRDECEVSSELLPSRARTSVYAQQDEETSDLVIERDQQRAAFFYLSRLKAVAVGAMGEPPTRSEALRRLALLIEAAAGTPIHA